MQVTESGLFIPEAENARKDRMRAWKTKADAQASRLQAELQKLDSLLEVDFVDPAAASLPPSERGLGVIPGRWHVIRRNPKGVDAWFPICGPAKEYRDPELAVVDEMKKADLWRPGALAELRKNQEQQLAAKDRKTALEDEQRRDEARLAFRSAKRMNGDGGLYRRFDKKGRPPKGE